MVKVKFFQKKIKSQGQGHKVKKIVSNRKVLPQEIYMWNMKALSFFIQKFKFFQK